MFVDQRAGANVLEKLIKKVKQNTKTPIRHHFTGCLRLSKDICMQTDIDSIHSIFQGSSAPRYLSTWLLESWHRSVVEQKYIGFKSFAWFYERYNYKVYESNVAIKRRLLLRIDQNLLLCIFIAICTLVLMPVKYKRNGWHFVKCAFCMSIFTAKYFMN